MSKEFEHLFTPFNIGKLTVKNRFAVSAMYLYEAGARGEFTNSAINYYVERAKGGFGLISTGTMLCDTEIDPYNIITDFSPNANPYTWICSARAMTDRVHAYDCKMLAQIAMGNGRNGVGLKSVSEVASFWDPSVKTGAYTKDEIKRKIDQFIKAAVNAKKGGFDGIEVHAMHWGYLLDQFAMSITNHRTDEYGGCLENRLRASREILDGIKAECGSDYPVIMKMGLKSFMTGLGYGQGSLDGEDEKGRTLEESIEIAKLLESYGYDGITCNVGNYESMFYACAPMYVNKGFVLPFSTEVKKHVNIPILVAGRMNDPYQSEKAIAEGMADCVVMARQSLADPHYPKKLEMGKPKEIRPCISCNEACVGRLYSVGCAAGCAVNPSAMHELEYSMAKTMEPKKVMVVGGGVGGMEAARVAKERGHDVELYERDAVLSGNQIAAGMHDFKQDIRRLNEWYHRQIDELEIPVHFNCDVTPEFIKEKHPDAVILAVGGTALMPKSIPGIDHPKSVCCTDALLGKREVGDTVVIVGGGMVGCEIALDYAMKGKKVSIVEALPDIISAGGGAPWMNAMYMKKALEKYKVDIYTSSKLASIDDEGAHIVAADDETKCSTLAADSVVVAIGFRPNPSMAKELLGEGMEVYEVKHANGIGNVMGAVWSAYEIARSL